MPTRRPLGIAIPLLFACLLSPAAPPASAQREAETPDVPRTADPAATYRIELRPPAPQRGRDDALVTWVIFGNFQCPFTARMMPTVEALEREFGRDLRIVWMNNPLSFHPQAMPAAKLALEAFQQGGNDKFWDVHQRLFADQRLLGRERFEAIAREAALNIPAVIRALDSDEHEDEIRAQQIYGRRFGARGTPVSFINGRFLSGAQPAERFRALIEAEREEARALVRRGTPRRRVYQRVIRDGETAAPVRSAAPSAEARPGRPAPTTVYRIDFPDPAPQRGPSDALVTMVMWSDFECPFCSRVEPTLQALRERYGDDLRIVWMNNPLPFHLQARPAARLALEAFQQGGNDKFWEVHDLLFEAGARALGRETFERIARQAGLDMDAVRTALDTDEHDAVIDEQVSFGRRFGATGTPAFYINGRFLSGAQPLERFSALIDEARAAAFALVASGVPRHQVYARTIANGATEVPAAPPPAPMRSTLDVPSAAPSRGPRDAPIVVQMITDFQCPFCSRALPTMEQLLRENDDVRLVLRDYPLPFHREAPLAHEAAREIYVQRGNAGFWRYHDVIFANQSTLTRENLERWAGQIGGVNMRRFRAALDERVHRDAIEASIAEVRAGLTGGRGVGTPTFVINGEVVSGARPFAIFQAAVDRARAALRR